MTNYSGQFPVPATSTTELFTEIGISPIHCQVSLHTDVGSPPLVMCNDISGGGVSFALQDSEGALFQFITDKDAVFIGNISGAALNCYYYLSAPA